MNREFMPFFLVWKTDEGIALEFYYSLGELYDFIHNHSEITGYSVFRTLEMKSF